MAGEGTKRIIDLTEAAETQSGDYIAIDSTGRGTRKLPAGFMATAADLSEEQTARQTADATLDGKITTETQARIAADNAIGEQITALDEKTEADAALIQNPTKTLSGALVSFTDGANMPMVACTASIVPKQSGTGTPSPDNERPISGWESVTAYVTDEQKYDRSDVVIGKNWIGGSDVTKATLTFAVEPSTQYRVLTKGGNFSTILFIRMENDTQITNIGINPPFDGYITTESNCNKVIIQFQKDTAITASDFDDFECSISKEYESYTVNLGRTVYGGTLDVVSGVLTVTHGILDLGDVAWNQGNRNTENTGRIFFKTGFTVGSTTSLCSAFEQTTLSWEEMHVNTYYLSAALLMVCADYSSPSDFKSAMSGVQLVYELAEPQTYQLTPTEVKTLLGENNVWADSGDVEITYRRDISIVINNLEAALNG